MGVQINGDTGNISATKADYSGNVTIGGTLTYEDVTNIDSVGLITARSGIKVTSGDIAMDTAGNITLGDSGGSTDDRLTFGASADLSIYHNGSNSYIDDSGTGNLFIRSNEVRINKYTNEYMIRAVADGAVELYHNNTKRFETTANGFNIHEDTDKVISFSGNIGEIGSVPGFQASNTAGSALASLGMRATDLRFATGSAERLRITSAGYVGIGENSPDNILHVNSGSTNTAAKFESTDTEVAIQLTDTTGSAIIKARNDFRFDNSTGELARIESNGNVVLNHTDSITYNGHDPKLSIQGTTYSESTLAIISNTNEDNGAYIFLGKQRSGSAGGSTVVQNGDLIGQFRYLAGDGTDLQSEVANITVSIDGTPGGNDVPGRITFATTNDGGNTSTERMRISKDGHVTKPTQFHIVVSRSGNQTGYNPSQGFGTGVVYNNSVLEQGTTSAALDTSNGRVTVPVAGIYFLEGSAYSSTAAFTQGWFIKNGSRLTYSDFMDNSGLSQNVNSNGFHKLAANDTIGFKAYGSQHTSVTVEASIYHTWMRITLVG